VNVAIPALRLGAFTDAQGHYSIANVPAGTYELRVTCSATSPRWSRVRSRDRTASLGVTLAEAPIEVKRS
jgi:hypothetical protein